MTKGIVAANKSEQIGAELVSIKWPLLIALAYIIVWPLYAHISTYNLDQNGDMLENYAWGIAWQWGYYKHPPLYAWITAAWFELFPKTDYSYRLLSGFNIASSIVLLWFIAKRLLVPAHAIIAVSTIFFLPPLTFLSGNYNATSAMVPFWAAIFLSYLVVIDKRTVWSAALFGVLCGLAVLIKYHSSVLILVLVIHSMYERDLRKIWLSWLVPVAAISALIVLAPHVFWLFETQFLTVQYAAAQDSGGLWGSLLSVLRLPIAMALYTLPVFIFFTLFLRYSDKKLRLEQFKVFTSSLQHRALSFAFVGSFLATCILALLLSASVPSLWSIPFFILAAPLLALFVPLAATNQWRKVLFTGIFAFSTVLLMASPIVFNQVVKRSRSNAALPVRDVAEMANRFWASKTHAPLKIVGGEGVLANGIAFYSANDPVSIQGLKLAITPWVKSGDIVRSGALMVCRSLQKACIKNATGLLGNVDFRTEIKVPGPVGSNNLFHDFTMLMRSPAL